jgi:ribosomal protein S27E
MAGGLIMPRRHGYMTRFRCPKCKRSGSAHWEESERVAGGHHVATLTRLSDGFRNSPQNEITCAACAVQVVTGHG